MTYPFVYYGAGGAQQCGDIGPSNYMANGAYANNMKSVVCDSGMRSNIFTKRQSEGNKEKFTLFTTFRRSVLARDSVTDKYSGLICVEPVTIGSAFTYLVINNNDQLRFGNAFSTGEIVWYVSNEKLVDTEGFYSVIFAVDGKNSAQCWINGKLITLKRTVDQVLPAAIPLLTYWNDSRSDIFVGGLKGLKDVQMAGNNDWGFRGEMCIAGLLDGVYLDTPNSLGFFDDRTNSWVPTIPDMMPFRGNSFCLVGRDKIVKDAYRHYMIGGIPNELNAVSPNKDPIGMVLQASYESVPDNPDLFTPLFGDDVALSLHGFRRTAKATWSADGRVLTQTDPYGKQANGNTNSLVHESGTAASLVFPNSPDKGMQFMKYTGTGNEIAIPHSFGKKPDLVMIAKVGAAQVGHTGTAELPYVWIRDGGDENGIFGAYNATIPHYKNATYNPHILSQKTDANNIYIAGFTDPATTPNTEFSTSSGAGRNHGSVIFTIGSTTYMAVTEYSLKTSAEPQTGGGIYLYRVNADNTVTLLDSKAHPTVAFVQYFTLGSDHYILVNANSTNPPVNSYYGKAIIYQINTATNKLGTKWETADLRATAKAEIFIDGSKAVITAATIDYSGYTDSRKAHVFDFDSTSGFHNRRDVPHLDGRRGFSTFLVGTERYGVSTENAVSYSNYNSATAIGLTKVKVCKWQTGSRTWGSFIDDMEFVCPQRPEFTYVFTNNGRIYMALSGSKQRFTMFDEHESRGVYLYEFEVAKLRFKYLDFVTQNGAWYTTGFEKDGKAYIAVSAREVYNNPNATYSTSILYRLSDNGDYLVNVMDLGITDGCILNAGVNASGKLIACVSSLGNVHLTADNVSWMMEWNPDAGYFTSKKKFTGNIVNQAGVEYFVMAFTNTENVNVERVGSMGFRTFCPAMTHTFVEDGVRYFVIATQIANLAPATDADYDNYGKILTYQYLPHRGTLVPVDDTSGNQSDSSTQVFEHDGNRYMLVGGVLKDYAFVSAITRSPKLYIWSKAKRTWSLQQTFPGQGCPGAPAVHDGELYVTFANRYYNSTHNHYPALWKFNATNKVFEGLTASRTDQKHGFQHHGLFSKNGKLWCVAAALWYPFNATTNYLMLFEVNPSTGVYTLVQNIEHDADCRKYCHLHYWDGETMVSVGLVLNSSNKRFGLYIVDTGTSRLVKVYDQMTVDGTANPIVNHIKFEGKHYFFFPAYNGTSPAAARYCGASTVLQYEPSDKTASVVNTFYSAGLIQLLPFEESGKLKLFTGYYFDVDRQDMTTNRTSYGNCHSNISVYNTKYQTIEAAWHNKDYNLLSNQQDFAMWIPNKEHGSNYGPDYYYDVSSGRSRHRYLFSNTALSGSAGNVFQEGNVLKPLYAPENQSRGYGLFVASDKWLAGFDQDIRTGNQFLSSPIHSGGWLATTSSPFNHAIKFSNNMKQAGKQNLDFVSAIAGYSLSIPVNTTGFASTPYVIPGWGSNQKDTLQMEITFTVQLGSVACGFATFADKTFSNSPMRMVMPRSAGGIVSNTWDIKSGDTVTFTFNYVTRKITAFLNGGSEIAKDMPENFMCFYVDQFQAATTSGVWYSMYTGQNWFSFPQPGALAMTAENIKQAYPIVRSKRFFDEGVTQLPAPAYSILEVTTEFSPDLVLIFDEGHARKHRWFYRGWGDNNFYSVQDFNGSLNTVLAGGTSGFTWNDNGFTMRKNSDVSWSGNEKIHYLAWDASRCSGMDIIEYAGSNTDVVLNLNNIEGTPDAVIIFSKNDAANRPSIFLRDFDNPGRNYYPLHTNAGIQFSATTILNFESKKLTVANASGYNQTGKEYVAVVFKSVPGFSHFGTAVSTGEIDSHNHFVGISPTAAFGATVAAAAGVVLRQASEAQGNPGIHRHLSNATSMDANSPNEFHSVGLKAHGAAPAGQKGLCMMWGSPWVYGQGR